jgi:hypothetical protein
MQETIVQRKKFTAEEDKIVKDMIDEGFTLRQIAARLERSRDSVIQRCQRLKAFTREDEAHEEEEEFDDPAVAWRSQEIQNARIIANRKRQRQMATKFSENKPIAIAFIGDQHTAPNAPVDLRRMREDAELVKQTKGMYALLAGDGTDNHIKHISAIISQRSEPDEQWRMFELYLSWFHSKILAICSGNHDLWTLKFAGIDMLRRISEQMNLRYSTNQYFLELNVAGANYKIGVRHQYRMNSSFNCGHAVRQWLRNGEEEFDVGCVAHHHEAAMDNFYYRGSHRIAVRPGSYQALSGYSDEHGYNDAVPVCPTVILYPGQRQMIGVFDIRVAAQILTQLR